MYEPNDFNQLVSINDTVNQILSKVLTIYNIVNRQSDHLSGRSGSLIEFDDDEKTDLLVEFINELERFDVDHDLRSGNYDPDDIKNKASFYFNNKTNINNPRAYLSKIVLSIKLLRNKPAETVIEPSKSYYQKKEDEDNDRIIYVKGFMDRLTDEMIEIVREKNSFARKRISNIADARNNPTKLYYCCDNAEKLGLFD